MSLSFWESLVGFVPVFIIQNIIQKREPREFTVAENKKRHQERKLLRLKQQENVVIKPLAELARLGSRSASQSTSRFTEAINTALSGSSTPVSPKSNDDNSHDVGNYKFDKSANSSPNDDNNDSSFVDATSSAGTTPVGTEDKKNKANEENKENKEDTEDKVGDKKAKEDKEDKEDKEVDAATWENVVGLKEIIIENEYNLPNWCRFVANGLIVVWAIICAIITSLWCVYFDVILDARNENSVESECIDYDIDFDISEKDWLNYNATEEYIANLTSQYYTPYDPPEGDSWGEDIETSDRFLYTVLTSYIISIVFWQPVIYFAKSFKDYWKLNKLLAQIETLTKDASAGQKKLDENLFEREKINQVILFTADLKLIESEKQMKMKQTNSQESR